MSSYKINAGDSESISLNFHEDNIGKLKTIFPELLTESADGKKINTDVLKALVGDNTVTDFDEKYGLNWHGKRRARQLALAPSTGTLRPCPEESVDWDTTQNLMIEGDNLEVLKLLQKSYASKVKIIYIDPPYNTGSDFVYHDSFQDNIRSYLELTGQLKGGRKISSNPEYSGRFHTDWLNMIYPRLKLARNLLRDDGIVFISINDNEIDNLRKICAEIFGEENFVEQFTVRSNPRGNQAKKLVASEHDYILCYAKRLDSLSPLGFPKTKDDFKKKDESGEDYREIGLRKRGAGSRREDAPNQYYPIYYNDETDEISTSPIANAYEIFPKLSDGSDGRWRWAKRTVEREKEKLIVRKVRRGDGYEYDVFEKDLFSEDKLKKIKSIFYEKGVNIENATEELRKLFDAKVFDYPKPVYTIKSLIECVNDRGALVVDFFAGSGTTGHAVIEQNATDAGNRRYVLVQLPEPLDPDKKDQKTAAEYCSKIGKNQNIAELTKERLRLAAKKTREDNPMFSGDVGFRVFRLDSTNIREWDPNHEDLEGSLQVSIEHLKTDRSEADILYELILKLGLDLCVTIEKRKIAGKVVYSIGRGVLLVCLDKKINRDEVELLGLGIVEWHQELAASGYITCVFRDSAFVDDVTKTNLGAILSQHGIANMRSL